MPPEPDAGPDYGSISSAADAEWQLWGEEEPRALVDLVNRVLDRGVVITGEITISVAGVDLVYLGLSAVLTSISTARRVLRRPVGKT